MGISCSSEFCLLTVRKLIRHAEILPQLSPDFPCHMKHATVS